MALVTKSIGTSSRDYSTPQAWHDVLPANVVTSGNSYRGEMYNDSEFTATVAFGAHTTDATHTITLTAAAGQSFCDNAGVRTNALRYDQTKGVGIAKAGNYQGGVSGLNGYMTVSRIQIHMAGTGNGIIALSAGSYGDNHPLLQDLVLQVDGGYAGFDGAISMYGRYINVVLVANTNTAVTAFYLGDGASAYNCLAIRPSDKTAGGVGFYAAHYAANVLLKNCASFGFTTAAGGLGEFSASCGNNATDLASGLPGSNNVYNVTLNAATPFTGGASTALDLRPVAGCALAAAGSKDATNAPNDITGTARATACTIGVWELGASTSTWTVAGSMALSSGLVAAALNRLLKPGATVADSSGVAAGFKRTRTPSAAVAAQNGVVAAAMKLVKTPAVTVASVEGVAASAVKRTLAPSATVADSSGVAGAVDRTLKPTASVAASDGVAGAWKLNVVPPAALIASSEGVAGSWKRTLTPPAAIGDVSSLLALFSFTGATIWTVAGAINARGGPAGAWKRVLVPTATIGDASHLAGLYSFTGVMVWTVTGLVGVATSGAGSWKRVMVPAAALVASHEGLAGSWTRLWTPGATVAASDGLVGSWKRTLASGAAIADSSHLAALYSFSGTTVWTVAGSVGASARPAAAYARAWASVLGRVSASASLAGAGAREWRPVGLAVSVAGRPAVLDVHRVWSPAIVIPSRVAIDAIVGHGPWIVIGEIGAEAGVEADWSIFVWEPLAEMPADRTLVVGPRGRTMTVEARDRALIVPLRGRLLTVR